MLLSSAKLLNTPRLIQVRHYAKECSVVVVGGGIIGTATARELKLRFPHLDTILVEKEPTLGFHQSGHNSGVIHAGVYYKPGSLKAKLCVEGLHLSYKYLEEKGIPYKECGKLIVAVEEDELPRLRALYENARQNGVPDVRLVDRHEIKQLEPHCEGIQAIWSPRTGIVDWQLVTQHYAQDFQKMGGRVVPEYQVVSISASEASQAPPRPIRVTSKDNKVILCDYVLTCGGLHSDRLAVMSGCAKDPFIVPFRGEYLVLKPGKNHLVQRNIYPVPDPRFPFLGVHFTPRMNGDVWLGPNAILAFRREGYRWTDVDWRELLQTVTYPGFRKLAARYARFGLGEMIRSAAVGLQLKQLQQYVPAVKLEDVVRGPSGVRAQAMDSAGNLVDDFIFDSGVGVLKERVLHCRNAPSPGATSSLAIASMIADQAELKFGFGSANRTTSV